MKEAISTSRCVWPARRKGNKSVAISKGKAKTRAAADHK